MYIRSQCLSVDLIFLQEPVDYFMLLQAITVKLIYGSGGLGHGKHTVKLHVFASDRNQNMVADYLPMNKAFIYFH